MSRILIIEDSEDAIAGITRCLEKLGDLVVARTLQEASAQLGSVSFDLVLLDVELPDGNGFQYCAELRMKPETANLPVIILTAHTEVSEKVMGLSLGADDYICKPFEPLELRARVQGKLTRNLNRINSESTLSKGALTLHLSQQRVYLEEGGQKKELSLTPLEFKLLVQLAQNEERILTREQLLDSSWGTQVHVLERTVDKHIASLRSKLKKCGHYVQTVPSVGYRFSTSPIKT